MVLLAFAGSSMAQVIADFEFIKLNLMLNAANDSSKMMVVPNPDRTGIDTSNWVVKFIRDKDGVPWGGFYSLLPTPLDVTTNKYVHVKVWKPRISPIKFKIEGGPGGSLETFSTTAQTMTNGWEEMVFNFSSMTGAYPTISFMPDFEDPLTLTSDIVIYFDDITINNNPMPGSAPVDTIADFETIPMTMMLNNPATDSSNITIVPNPDRSGIDTSNWVAKFIRDWHGIPWGGFFSNLLTPVDLTTNKYFHVKVWKPRISPVKFKVQGGAAGDLEIFSTNVQTMVMAWEDMVFDFSSKTGTYPIITFMPDFEDPLTLTSNIIIYFDDIILNNNPNPITGTGRDLAMTTGDVTVYPVPFSSYLNVKSAVALNSVVITSSTGQQVIRLDNPVAGVNTINTAMLAKGLYFVTFNTQNGKSVTLKVMNN